jgi:hypothetical protein
LLLACGMADCFTCDRYGTHSGRFFDVSTGNQNGICPEVDDQVRRADPVSSEFCVNIC